MNVDQDLPNLSNISLNVAGLKIKGLSDDQIKEQYLTGIKNRYEAVNSKLNATSPSPTLDATGESGGFRPFAKGTSPTANLTLTPGTPARLETSDYFPLQGEVNFLEEMTFGNKEMTFGDDGKPLVKEPFGLDLTLKESGVTYKDGTLTFKGKGESRTGLLNSVFKILSPVLQ